MADAKRRSAGQKSSKGSAAQAATTGQGGAAAQGTGQGASGPGATGATRAVSTKHDLIIRNSIRCTITTPFNLRWKFTEDDEVIDLNRVQDYDYRLLGPTCLSLKRIKIFQLDAERLIRLLWTIGKNRNNSLERLEIDKLALTHPKEPRARFHFYSLQSLAIDAVVVVDEKTGKPLDPVPVTSTSASFLAPDMKMLQLGPNCIQYLIIGYPEEVQHLVIGPEPDFTRFKQFSKLRDLVVNDIEHSDLEAILEASRQKHFKRLFCYLRGMTSTTFQPDQRQLAFLQTLYGRLRVHEPIEAANRFRDISQPEPKVDFFFNGVKLSFEQVFADYHFEERLINVHHRNVVSKAKLVTACRSVNEIDYLGLFEKFFETKTNPPEKSIENIRHVFKLWKLAQIYPCVQCIKLISERSQALDSNLFIDFLRHRQAIRELHVRFSLFPASFYRCLGDLNSLKHTLCAFIHSDPFTFDLLIDFRYLTQALKHITTLSTSHATRRTMLELVQLLPSMRHFIFRFWNPTLNTNSFYECQIIRLRMKAPGIEDDELDDDDDPRYSLTVEYLDFSVSPQLNFTVYTKEMASISGIAAFFNKQENSLITAHPLDGHETRVQY